MVSEVKKRYPKFYKDAVFAQMAKNRKIIALLNYAGLSGLSKLILSIKAKSKGY